MSTTTAYDDFANIDGCLNVIPGISHYRVGFGIVFAAVIATALFLLILVTAILFRFKHSKKQPIYGLLNLLNITQVIYLIPSVIVMLPCTFSSCPFYSNPAIVLLSLPDTFGFYASSTLNCLIAIERISMFLFTPLHYFVERHTIAYGSISWIIGLLVMFLTTFIGCYKRFNPYSIAFSYECGSCDLFKNVNLLTMLMWITQVMVIVMLIGYIVVVGSMKLKSSLRTKKRRFTRQEAGLLLQGGLICLCQWMVIVFFFDIRTILEDEPVLLTTTNKYALKRGNIYMYQSKLIERASPNKYILYLCFCSLTLDTEPISFIYLFDYEVVFVTNMVSIVNSGIQPLILLLFNKTVRESCWVLFGFKTAQVHTVYKSGAEITKTITLRKT